MFDPAIGSADIARAGLLSHLRAWLQPRHKNLQENGALAPEGVAAYESKSVLQRLKPHSESPTYGTAEAVPLCGSSLFQRMFSPFRVRWAQAAIVCCLAVVMLGAGDTSEKRYERVGHNMMCACGCGQILLECNHVGCPDSTRMDNELRTLVGGGTVAGSAPLAQGGSDKDILNWFVEKYGATVLASPIRGGFDNVAWITPISIFLLSILGTAALIRIWKSRTQQRAPLKIDGMSATSTDELRERIRRETHY